MKYCSFIILFLVLVCCQPKHDVPTIKNLNHNWQFKAVNDSVWKSAIVPGNVHSDLLNHELIAHPFIGRNEDSLQWISETDWVYKTNFSVDKETLNKNHIQLNFEGLDTYASIFLNDSLILKADNAFREFIVDIKPLLELQNELRVRFEHTSISEEKAKSQLNYQLPEGHRIFTRKAQFQYGWDWGPKLNTSGIWRSVSLEAWDDVNLKNINIIQFELNDDFAHLGIQFDEIVATNFNYQIYVNDSLYKSAQSNFNIDHRHSKSLIPISIANPKRWWPHNLGEPYLYDFKVIVKDGTRILDSISVKKGLRTIELVTEKDSIGNSFYFKVNDVPVYMKGANYIPQNSMQNQVTNYHYENLLNNVVDANMNMLRVWGGGIYENDIFYDLCDEKGILIWQDFMFACAMYPGDKSFLKNIEEEAIYNIKRLRNHASIALWCGNNESSEGWHRWGWQTDRSNEEKEIIWKDYLKVFDSILPRAVHKYSNTSYWESSPKFGRGNPKYKTEGDAHDWWIWHDAYPFEHLENNVPRFMSEFGFQSFPSYEAIRYINQNDAIKMSSEGFKNHQKHARGFQLIDEYMTRDFPVPTKADDYVYVSQLLQAYGITKGIEAHRRAKPYNMGTLYWQLNDCWPAISWSSIDFFGNWKALHYQSKKSFENLIISFEVDNNILKTFTINDSLIDITGPHNMRVLDFEGNELIYLMNTITAKANSSELHHKFLVSDIKKNHSEVVIVSEFNNKRSIYYLVKPKDLKLKKAPIEKTISRSNNGFRIQLKSTTLQKNVFLYTKAHGHFSDNYFDMLPNETIWIDFETKTKNLEELKIKTLNDLL